MIYPEGIEEKLGFDVIRNQLLEYCISDLGRKLVIDIRFETNLASINYMLDQANEFAQLIAQGDSPAIGAISDISPYLDKSSIQGNWLSSIELFDILLSIASALQLEDFINNSIVTFPALRNLVPGIKGLSSLEKKLLKSVDKDGIILSSASPELRSIRQKMLSEEGALRRMVDSIFKKAKSAGYVPEGATIGLRDGRMVIPVIAANKKQIKGFVHDESATGNIVFLEPATILDANNKIRELQLAEGREIKRILIALTSEVDEHHTELEMANEFLAKVDLLWAKAKLSRSLAANRPRLSQNRMELRELKHPLLILGQNKQARKVIPHDIHLQEKEKIMLISGPNAGGKSVALKSVGLNQMMLQSGILPCCHPDSQFRILNDLFIDIGDEQSIDNDLSTYSSHLKNMSVMLAKASNNSLILIDEFGSGTDPTFGGAIAEAVLQKLNDQGCYGIITTHFSNLKLYADKTKGIINAAMIFDLDKLIPLYEIETGRPGSSFSLEVATQSGLPQEVIDRAQKGIGSNQIDIERLLGKLENEKRKLEEQNEKLANKNIKLSILMDEYELLKKKLEDRQKEIINTAREEASGILSRTNKEIEKTIRHIKENKAEKKETKKVRQSLQNFAHKIEPEIDKPGNLEIVTSTGKIQNGDQALIIDKEVIVEVVEVKGKKAKVLIGELQSVIALNKLKKISKRQAKQSRSSKQKAVIPQAVMNKITDFSPILDVRGTRANELLPALQRFLDEAVMLNQSKIKIIHGKGNGVLRKMVRDELNNWTNILSFEKEHVERGGDGATVVAIK